MSILFVFLLIFTTVPDTEIKVEVKPKEVIVPVKRADFNISYKRLRELEGNYVNDPNDPGGVTYAGITKRFNPKWMGWYYIDNTPNKKWNQYIPECEYWVRDHFLDVWASEGFYLIENQELADYLFDMRIHLHIKGTIKIINRTSCTDVKYEENWASKVPEDINLYELSKKREIYYLNLIKRRPNLGKYKKNWIKRARYVHIRNTTNSLGDLWSV